MKSPELTRESYEISLTIMEFSIMTFLTDNFIIDLYDDHMTNVRVTEMNGHFGSNIYVDVDIEYKGELSKFTSWVKSIVDSNNQQYLLGVEDAQNGRSGRFESESKKLLDLWENDEISDDEYKSNRIPHHLYDIGHNDGLRWSSEKLNSYILA